MSIPVTIALLTYNRSAYLREALTAILEQSYSDFELLVMDNHSTDDTSEVVKAFKDPRLTYVRQASGGNPDANSLSAIWMSRGDYLLITHDDDIMEPTLLERQMALLEVHPDLLLVASNVSLMDKDGRALQPRMFELEENLIFPTGAYIQAFLEEKLCLPAPTFLCRREAMTRMSARDLRKRASEVPYMPTQDVWVACWLNSRGPIALLAEPLLRYRQHPKQECRTVHQGRPLVQICERILRSAPSHPVFRQVAPAARALRTRFQAQDLLFQYPEPAQLPELRRALDSLRRDYIRRVSGEARLQESLLPFEILLKSVDLEPCNPHYPSGLLEEDPHLDGARRAYRAWMRRGSLGFPPSWKRIALLGSQLTAFLVAAEARRQGLELMACLDSSPARQGQPILGIPVLPFSALKRELPCPDAILLTGEKDQEASIRALLEPYLPHPALPMLSWKELPNPANPT